jgi:hypothetical protein
MRDSAAAIHAASPTSAVEIVSGCGHGIPPQQPECFLEIFALHDGRGDLVGERLTSDGGPIPVQSCSHFKAV